MNNNNLISLKNITKTFKSKDETLTILNNINLDIKKGEYISAIGPSGSGKSTLLYIMGLLLNPDKGEIIIKGTNALSLSDKKKSFIRNQLIGFIFQSYHLLPEFSALENIILPSILKGTSKTEALKKATNLLAKVDLLKRESHKPNELSGGEQQRICICRALINEPAIIFADEPTGNLDSHNASNIIDILENMIKEENTTLVLVTHNEKLAERATRTIKLLDGNIFKEKY